MTQPSFFGPPQRTLFGILHEARAPLRGSLLACAPLLQEGIRSQRALWSLAEALAVEGVETLRFDWFGSGDSGGDSEDMAFAGLLDDLGVACSHLRPGAAPRRARLLALRSAALPALARAVAADEPVDLVLWDPQLSGGELVADWRRQHRQQLGEVGRYRRGEASGSDELLGFVVDPALLDALAAVDADATSLPSGSRVLLATWDMTPRLQRFIDAQGPVEVEQLLFDSADRPPWDDAQRFEDLALPRRSVAQLARHLGSAAW